MKINGYETSTVQEEAAGQLVVDHWGCNFQTNVDVSREQLILWAQRTPSIAARRFEIDRDGTVTETP